MSKAITLNIVSGFLGAGKTTFIRHLLQVLMDRQNTAKKGEKVVYVVNEFGQTGLDASLVECPDIQSYELANGCICCTLKAEFSQLLGQIIEQHDPDRIVFEPSGLFILSELFSALSGEPYSGRLRIGAIITLIDAVHAKAQRKMFSPVIVNQAAYADYVVVSKLAEQDPDFLEKSMEIQFQLPDRPLILKSCWDFSQEDWTRILDFPARPLRRFKLDKSRQLVHENLYQTRVHPALASLAIEWTGEETGQLIASRLAELTDGRFGTILRAKGLFWLQGQPQFLQMVYTQQEWRPARRAEADDCARLIIIGERLDRERILQHLGVSG